MTHFCKKILCVSLALSSFFFFLVFKVSADDLNSPKSADFAVAFLDTDTGGSGLDLCEYRVESLGVVTQNWTTRGCSTQQAPVPVNITVGPTEDKNCRDAGDHTCKVIGRATDNAGNVSAGSAKLFSIAFVCAPPVTGDWDIATTCVVENQAYTMSGNIIIRGTGTLDMRGTTNITFDTSADRYVYVEPGGQLLQAGTAGFNK